MNTADLTGRTAIPVKPYLQQLALPELRAHVATLSLNHDIRTLTYKKPLILPVLMSLLPVAFCTLICHWDATIPSILGAIHVLTALPLAI